MMRIIHEGGSTIDPRDPSNLAVLPVADNVELNLEQALAYRAALDEFIAILHDNHHNPAYLDPAPHSRPETADEPVCDRHQLPLEDNGHAYTCTAGCEVDELPNT